MTALRQPNEPDIADNGPNYVLKGTYLAGEAESDEKYAGGVVSRLAVWTRTGGGLGPARLAF